jgi:hypothetical protein
MEEQKKKAGRWENKRNGRQDLLPVLTVVRAMFCPATSVAMILVLCRRQGSLVDLSPPQFWSSGSAFLPFPRVPCVEINVSQFTWAVTRYLDFAPMRGCGGLEIQKLLESAHVPTSPPLGAFGRDTTVLDHSACSRRVFQSASSAFRGTSPLASIPVCRYPAVPQKATTLHFSSSHLHVGL